MTPTAATPGKHGDKDSRALYVAIEMLRYALLDPAGLPAAIAKALNAVLSADGGDGPRRKRRTTPTAATTSAVAAEARPMTDLATARERAALQLLKLAQIEKQNIHKKLHGTGLGDAASFLGQKAKDGGAAIGNMFLNRLQSTLGPLAIFAQVLQSVGSGFGVLSTAVKVLATSLAPLILPIVVVLATAILELSNVIWKSVVPVMKKFFAFVVENILPVLRVLANALGTLIGIAIKLGGALVDAVSSVISFTKDVLHADESKHLPSTVVRMLDSATGGDFSKKLPKLSDAARAASGESGGKGNVSGLLDALGIKTKGTFKAFDGREKGGTGKAGGPEEPDMLKVVLAELRTSIGPKASFSGIAQAQRNAQLAALNQSPMEKMMLDRLDKMLRELEAIAGHTGRMGVGV